METTTPPPPADHCPACGWHPGPSAILAACPRCALPLTGEPVAELRRIDAALVRLDAERGRLLARRGQLLAAARPVWPVAAPVGWGRPVARESSPRTAQNVLLSLGGVLLAVAAMAFTLVSWGRLGIGGRAVVLGALTAAVMAAPALLVRRALNATGEVVACLGLVLLLLDTYAIRRLALPGGDGLRYAAVSLAVVSALWALYGRLPVLRRLALPASAALLLAQPPLPLAAVASGSLSWLGAALSATAALDVFLAARAVRSVRSARTTAAVAGTVTGLSGLLVAFALAVDAEGYGPAARAGLLLLAGAGLALAAGFRSPGWATTPLAAVAGLGAVAAFGGTVRQAADGGWAVPGCLLCGVAVLAAAAAAYVRNALPRAMVAGLAIAAGLVGWATLLWALPALVVGVFGPFGWLDGVWTGAPDGARAAIAPHLGWSGPAPAVAVAAVLATVAAAAGLRGPAGPVLRRAARCAALALGAVVAAGLPAALDLPYPVAVLLRVATVALLLVAARAVGGRAVARTALGGAVALAVTAVAWGLAERPMTLLVLALLLAAFGGVAWGAVGPAGAQARAVGGAAAVACAAGLAWAGPLAAGWPAYGAAFVVLAVAAGAVTSASVLRAPALEYAGYATLAVALVLATGDTAVLALVLGLAGVLAGAVAVRADRRPAAGYAAAALMIAASWVRLAASDIAVPEAYTIPVSVAALGVGLLRRRRDASASSWAAYGPGLAATLCPSLFAAWTDPLWLRPLLLGSAALAVTALGARHRLQAPLLLGGAVLALDALHELAPYVLQAVGALPRWLPLALAGVLLLAAGATYEQRLRDVRRVRDLLGRLR